MEKYSHIVWPDGITDQQKQAMLARLESYAKEKERLCVVYTPDCGCDVKLDVVLDRYPMSKKIHNICKICSKWVLDEISDPIEFYLPMLDQTFFLEDLIGMVIMNSEQAPYIAAYQCEAIRKQKRKTKKRSIGPSRSL